MTIVVVRRQKRITMEGSASLINSRATAIKTILLTAWRNKLTCEEWETRIRKVLPRGVNGDVYDLADCLLKQALVGSVPNQLFISYLKHAVKCELVSHGAVLSSIAHQSTNIKQSNHTPNRTSSVICLLEFLKSFRDRISCTGTEVECLTLCHALGQLIHWLLRCVQHSLESLSGGATNIPVNSPHNPAANISGSINYTLNDSTIGIIDLCTEMIHYFINRPFTKSLLFISKIEYNNEFEDIIKAVQVIQQRLISHPNSQLLQDRIPHCKVLQQLNVIFNSRNMHPSVVAAQQLRCLQIHRIRSTHVTSGFNFEKKVPQSALLHDSTTNHALFNSIYSMVAFDVVLRAARPHKQLARQIAIITNFNSAPISMTYCELIRACMIGLIDTWTHSTSLKIKWVFFSFLKMPKILIELGKVYRSLSNLDPSNYISNFIDDLKLASERLCEYSPLLDETEFKCNCDFFKCLVDELIKNDPNLAPQIRSINFRKIQARYVPPSIKDGPTSAHMISRSESVVAFMLKTLATQQDPEELLSYFSQLVNGQQFEFLLNAAASSGRLHILVRKLLDHNEINRLSAPDTSRDSQVQAYIFDMTFLILTYTAQQYGHEVITNNDQQTTFTKWFYDCYNTGTRINCPKEMLKDSNDEVVSKLIKQLVNPEETILTKCVDWREVCTNMPKVINEILIAWNQGVLDDNDISEITEKIQANMCSLAVVSASWLQCHIRTLSEPERAKPLKFLYSLIKPSHSIKQQKQNPTDSDKSCDESYPKRTSLMTAIIRKIYFELDPKRSSSTSNTSILNNSTIENEESQNESAYLSTNGKFISTLTTQEIFLAIVKQCLNRGWMDHKSLTSLSSLFNMIGSECFTNLIVEQILTSHESPSDLSRAVNITFGLFHLDIEACAFALLKDTVPSWLMGEKKQVLLNQPRAFALAHLTVMTIIEVFNNLKASRSSDSNNQEDKKLSMNGIKQEPGAQKQTAMEVDSPPDVGISKDVKRIKLSTQQETLGKELLAPEASERLEKLNSCIADLMRLFREIMSDNVMSQRTLFPVLFLQQTVVCTREGSAIITVHLQPEILLDIINLFSSELTFELVLAISNLSTTNSRRFAAKAMCQLAKVKEPKQDNSEPSQVQQQQQQRISTNQP